MPFGYSTQQSFEALVRATWASAKHGAWIDNPVATAEGVHKILAILRLQPELLDGPRLNHNLGASTMKWLRDLWASANQCEVGGG